MLLADVLSPQANSSTSGSDPGGLDNDLRRSFDINVIGNIHLFNLFMPFVLNGRVKKVVALSTGMADLDLVNDYSIQVGAPYSISKAALNLAVAKFNARYKREGVLFLSISPGFVETGQDQDGKRPKIKKTHVQNFGQINILTTEL